MNPLIRPGALFLLGACLSACEPPLSDAAKDASPDATNPAGVDACRDASAVDLGSRGTETLLSDRCVVEWRFSADPCTTTAAVEAALQVPLRRLPAPHLAPGIDLYVGATDTRDVEVVVRRDTGCAEAATAEWSLRARPLPNRAAPPE